MTLSNDYREILCGLSNLKVKYMVVGGYAFAAYGHPRATLDLDIFVEATRGNADLIYKALAEFGAPLKSINVSASDFISEGTIIQIGVQPQRIDIISRIDGVNFADAYSRAVECEIDGLPVRVISLEDLLANKKAAGRPKDLADVITIEHMLADKNRKLLQRNE